MMAIQTKALSDSFKYVPDHPTIRNCLWFV
jgi:hypothetical protein